MILFSFVLFAVLIAGWLIAPAGSEEKALKEVAVPVLTAAEVAA